jgi:hypothetical protein
MSLSERAVPFSAREHAEIRTSEGVSAAVHWLVTSSGVFVAFGRPRAEAISANPIDPMQAARSVADITRANVIGENTFITNN